MLTYQFLAVNKKTFKKHVLFKAGAWLGDVAGRADSGTHALAYADVCWRMLTYAHADVCWRLDRGRRWQG
jgi:hypothetical protein